MYRWSIQIILMCLFNNRALIVLLIDVQVITTKKVVSPGETICPLSVGRCSFSDNRIKVGDKKRNKKINKKKGFIK